MQFKYISYQFCLLLLIVSSWSGCSEDETLFVSLNTKSIELQVGNSFQYELSIQGIGNKYNATPEWSVYKSDAQNKEQEVPVLSIDETGLVKALNPGSAVIKASLPNNRYALSYVTVSERTAPSSEEIMFVDSEYYLSVAEICDTMLLKVTEDFTKNFKNYDVKVLSSNSNLVTGELRLTEYAVDKDGNITEAGDLFLNEKGFAQVIIRPNIERKEGDATLSVMIGETAISSLIHVGMSFYLSFEPINLSLGNKPEVMDQNSVSISIHSDDTIQAYFRVNPNDDAHIDRIKFEVSIAGNGGVLVKELIKKGEMIYLPISAGFLKGTSDITIASMGKKITASVNVFDPNDTEVQSIKFSQDTIITDSRGLALFDMLTIKPLAAASIWPAVWSSSDESIAFLPEDIIIDGQIQRGNVSIIKAGEVYITARSKDKEAKLLIISKLRITEHYYRAGLQSELLCGESTYWETIIMGNYATDEVPVNWLSVNPDIAEVDQSGKVTAKREGTTEIVASVIDDFGNEKSIRKQVTVLPDNAKIYDLNFGPQYDYDASTTSSEGLQGLSIDVYDPALDNPYYNFRVLMNQGTLNLSENKVYYVKDDLSLKSQVIYYEADNSVESALFESGTLEVKDGVLIFDLVVKKGSKMATVKGSVAN